MRKAGIEDILRNSVGKNGKSNKPDQSDLTHTKTPTKLGDNYLPVLRNFSTTQRIQIKRPNEVVKDFKKNEITD